MMPLNQQIEMKEEDRLAAVVARIDEEVGVVPRGAYMKTPLGEVVLNKSFQGMETHYTGIRVTVSPPPHRYEI